MYEIQTVVCENKENLLWNFDRFNCTCQKTKGNNKIEKIKEAKLEGVLSKKTRHKSIVLTQFIQHNMPYCVRIRAKTRNGWGKYSDIKYIKTKEKKRSFVIFITFIFF